MLPSLQGISTSKNSILSRGIFDQRILQSDWQESLLATSNEKWKSQIPPFLDSYLNTTHLKYRLIPSRDIGDQRILHSDWMRDTHDHVKPKVIASLAAFPCWLTTCKKRKTSVDSFQKNWWSQHPAVWLDQRLMWPHPTKKDIVDQRILQSNWMRSIPGHNQPKVIASDATLRFI